MANTQGPAGLSRRRFLKLTGFGAATLAASSVPLFHFKQTAQAEQGVAGSARSTAKLSSWEDLYRQRWTWDKVAKGTHGWANCRSACEWDLYIKDGIVVREEQTATYKQSEEGVPDFNPRGCQKGACYTEVMYGPSRTTVPMKRIGRRGSGKWKKISWEQAMDEIARKMIDVAAEHGTDTIYQDLGPNFDNGPTTVARFKFLYMTGGIFADNWAEIGDLNIGATMTMGFAHTGGSSDEWFLSDYLVVWMMNPSVTQISDAHFLFEAKYNGTELVIVDPHYSATTTHADQWLPIETATDAALGLATARHIWDSGNIDLPYLQEQTDLPLLVRLDTGRFLREEDLVEGGLEKKLYVWDPATKQAVVAPGCLEAETYTLSLNGLNPPIEGQFEVSLKDGSSVVVVPVGSMLKEHLDPWTFERCAAVTGLSVEQIRTFADGFAKAKRPMILSSWGANRFMHSDLMNRAKLLCLALKGAIGKKGAGYQATGWVGLDGFGSELQVEHEGLRGKIAMMLGIMGPEDIWHMTVDILKKRRTQEQATRDGELKYEEEVLCTTNVTSVDYRYQGIKKELDKEVSPYYPRTLEEYFLESEEKGWEPGLPRKGSPKIFFTGGSNLLRRSNLPQNLLENMWSKMELIVDINPKTSFTSMYCDYILPASGWYEKSSIKYAMSYIPYLHYGDAAVPALYESKDEFEIHWLLTKRIQELAKEQDLPAFPGCKVETDWKTLHTRYSNHGALGQHDTEKLCQNILDASGAAGGATVEGLKKTGISKYTETGANTGPVHLYNPDWKGEGVLNTLTQFTEYKDRWPTYSGRLTTYIDHPWFLETGEAFTTHKGSPKAGGDYPFQMVSCHNRWSIHSMWRDTPMLLRMQRGEPVMYLCPAEAEKLGIADNQFAEIFNDYGTIRMRIKYSTMVRPGVAYYFHAWEPHQFPKHESYKWLIPGLINPLHFAGGYGQITHGLNKYQPGTHVQDTRVGVRPWTDKNQTA